ncbi:MAG: N-ethylmaleimide reductase [Candidatus Azotimanducaceae bacterium]|jgi:N-ethylmaleimide reductase
MPKQLLEPLSLSGLSLRNRIAMAPMTRARSGADRIPKPIMAEYYAQRASAGLIITEATTVSAQGNGWNESPGIYTDAMAEGWKPLTEAVHAQGGTIFLQLWHCGRASHSDFHDGAPTVSASAIKLNGDHVYTPQGKKDYQTPRALQTDEIPGVIADYKAAAERAKAAGFDGIEMHAANGYLLNQFLESKTNQRADAYGGSIENRTRLLLEVVAAVSEVFPANRVGVRLSPNGAFNDMGSTDYREQYTYAATELNKIDLAYLHVMDGLAFGFHELGEPMTLKDFRAVFDGTLIGNCGYDLKTAEAAVAAGDADLIAIGRPYLATPDIVERYEKDIPLNPDTDMSTWYTPAGAEGYSDQPTAKEAGLL